MFLVLIILGHQIYQEAIVTFSFWDLFIPAFLARCNSHFKSIKKKKLGQKIPSDKGDLAEMYEKAIQRWWICAYRGMWEAAILRYSYSLCFFSTCFTLLYLAAGRGI